MRFERLSWLTWLLIAVAVGFALAWMQANLGMDSFKESVPQANFEMLLRRSPVSSSDGKEFPWIKSIVVYPAIEAGFAIQTPRGPELPRLTPVTFQMLIPVPEQKGWTYKSATILPRDPFIPTGMGSGDQRLMDLLADMKKESAWVDFKYAWWREPKANYMVWIGASVLLIGIIWPIVLRLLVKAGYGAPPEKFEKKESLWRRLFGRKPKPVSYDDGLVAASKPATASLSQEELSRIEQMEADLQDFLQQKREQGGEVEDEPQPAAIRQLNAGPLQGPASDENSAAEKAYGGEFYPTVAHGKKKPD